MAPPPPHVYTVTGPYLDNVAQAWGETDDALRTRVLAVIQQRPGTTGRLKSGDLVKARQPADPAVGAKPRERGTPFVAGAYLGDTSTRQAPESALPGVPFVHATIDRPSGLHELWLMQTLADGSPGILAGPEPWPPGWVALYNRAKP